MEDDAMEIEEIGASAPIIVREETGVQIIGGPSHTMDVVVLDDDDEEEAPPKLSPVMEPPRAPEIIDLVQRSVNNKCINYACVSGVDMITAPKLCLSYYRVRNMGQGRKEICTECYNVAMQEYDVLVNELKKGNILSNMKVPVRHDTVEIDDSDEEEDADNQDDIFDEIDMETITSNFDRIFQETLDSVKFPEHSAKEFEFLKNKQMQMTENWTLLQQQIKETRDQLDQIQINLYQEFQTETKEENPLTIIDDNSLTNTPIPKTDYIKGYQQRKSKRNVTRQVSYVGLDSPGGSPKPPEEPTPVTTLPKDVPVVGTIEKPQINLEELYYISRETSTGSWIKARLKAVIPVGAQDNNTVLYKVLELKQHKERLVDGKHIASMRHSRIRLEPGSRVVAAFKELGPFRRRHDPCYPGVVAEPPVAQNKYRYLIFFDIGYSQYVNYSHVHIVFESSVNVWEDMHQGSRAFIKKYLESADKAMVKLAIGQTIRTEYNGKWLLCNIVDVDCSLVRVRFESISRLEWIYRGSTRLSPMFKEEQNATKRHNYGGATRRTTRKEPGESATIVQYTKNSDFAQNEAPPKPRAVAKKSTASKATYVPFLPQITDSLPLNEPKSKILYFTPRDQVITQRLYRPHTCCPSCKDYVRLNAVKLLGQNPLSKPLLAGWARMTQKAKGRKEVIYKAPCGRILRNMKEIHRYLRLVKSEMTVDMYDFNMAVRCLADFHVECQPDPADLSAGLEDVPIPVINGINDEMLDFCNYNTQRSPMDDVPLNVDPEFLTCCDCTDDCADKSKCACWRLTLEGAKYMGKNVDPNSIGYVYRRLHEQVLTGIYECNSRCKCAATCLNRVVQNPMSIKLQVFRTHNRGWGIRCVNDVPQGTFICIYAGTIHTEQMANKDGVTFGDEYFAELDYIENCEKHKEDYESDVNDGGDSSPRSRSVSPDEDEDARRKLFKKRYKTLEDNDFLPGYPLAHAASTSKSMRLRKRNQDDDLKASKKEEKIETITSEIETVTISDDDDDPKEVLSFNPKAGSELDDTKPSFPSIRAFYGEEEPYIMDTKNAGNIGRFLNHSCSPNVFVQNVFVDTHDLRFPWVAFFCSQYIRAGTELTWNYNYDIGSVPGRVLYCHCGSYECKGRLL